MSLRAAVFLIFINCCVCRAQHDGVTPPRLALRWSPIHLTYYHPSAQFALEHQVFKKFNVQYDAGFIVNNLKAETEEYKNRKGYRALIELRYYMPSPDMVPFYLAADFYYSKISFDRAEIVGYNCDSGNCDFFQYLSYKVKNNEYGPGLKFGLLLFPGWNRNHRFFFDLNSGFAYRKITYDFPLRPQGAVVQSSRYHADDFVTPREDNRWQLRFVIGLRMGFRFL